ncbi:MAG: DUF3426 domain-containing protein [Pseudoxanthomonas sp.]
MGRICRQCQQETDDDAACLHCGAAPEPTPGASLAGYLRAPVREEAGDTSAPTQPVATADDSDDRTPADGATAPDVTHDTAPTPSAAVVLPESSDARDDTPRFSRIDRTMPAQPRTGKWQWTALGALGLLLVLQILLADRERLAADAGWRPLLGALCGALGCTLPPWREPQAFTMLSRDVRPQPDAPGALLAQATFRNDARWPQPWPVLQLSLSDADGRTVGARAFTAAEYLDKSEMQAELAPGQSAQVSMRLREPREGVVAFSFEFR